MKLKIARASKNYRCELCKKTIKKGEKYVQFYFLFGVKPSKYHIKCWNKEHPLLRVGL
jgi:hypothetical protein